jgi:hypothetical protein
LDQDDLMVSDKLERQLDALLRMSVDLVLADHRRTTIDGTVLWNSAVEIYGEEYAEMITSPGSVTKLDASTARRHFLLACGIPSSCSNQFFHKKLWERHGGFDPRQGVVADYDFILRALDRPVAWIDQVLFIKREQGNNLWQNTVANHIAVLRVQQRVYRECGRPKDLARIVAKNTRVLVRRLRREGSYTKALSESMYLATLPDFRGLVAELARTCSACVRQRHNGVV